MNRWCGIVLCGALLGGCAATPGPETMTPPAGDPVSLLDELGRAPIGTPRVLTGANALASREVTIIDAYQAASGRPCRTLSLDSGERRIICLDPEGHWSLQRRIVLSSPSQGHGPAILGPTVAVQSLADVTVEPEPLQGVLAAGETLWSFSVRTTGSGENWRSIARVNDIPDAEQVLSGTTLIVPGELALARGDTGP